MAAKKPYEAPVLTEHGDLRKITQGSFIGRKKFERFHAGDAVKAVGGKGKLVGGLLDEAGAVMIRS